LKEERARLAKSQTDFAALAGGTKSTQISWEKDATAPNATALAAMAKFGVDVLYVLTGKRSDPALAEQAAEDAQAQLDLIEERLGNPGPEMNRADLSEQELREGLRIQLQQYATDPAFAEPVQSRADEILRRVFDDQDAGKRRAQRYASVTTRLRNATRDLDDAVDALDLTLPPVLHHHMLALVTKYGIEMGDLIPLLSEMARRFPKRGSQLGEPVR
jgi:transcriptional regulator with XRE-family HTH domain